MAFIEVFGAFFATCFAVSSGTNCSPEDVAWENLHKLSTANNELAFNMYRRLVSNTSSNVFFSPLGISTAFGMLLYGTRGETSEELRKALGYEKAELPLDLAHEAFHRYLSDLKNGNSTDGYVLSSANAILVDKSVELLEEYEYNVKELYGAAVRNVDFLKESSKIVGEINDWIKKETNDKIEKFLEELSPTTALVLLNTVYFKGTWETRFSSERTKNGRFYNYGRRSEAKSVPMMHTESDFPVAFFDDFKALGLPYKGGNVSMLILLPTKKNGLSALEDSLTPKKLEMIQERMHYFNMVISMPKFKLEFKQELSRPLQELGVNRIFNAEANFSGMTPNGGVSASQILHKAVFEVNEEGSEAAAATGFIMFKSGSFTFRVNIPFLFAIMKDNMVLFLGRVTNL